jgi:hypothetical protein
LWSDDSCKRLFAFDFLSVGELLGAIAGFLGGHDFLLFLKYWATDNRQRVLGKFLANVQSRFWGRQPLKTKGLGNT